MNLAKLARELKVEKIADDWQAIEVNRFSDLETADGSAISFISYSQLRPKLWAKNVAALQRSGAAAVLAPIDRELDYQGQAKLLPVANVDAAIQRCLQYLHPEPELTPTQHPSASIAASASLAAGVYIGAHAVIGDGCAIASGCVIKAGCVLGANCSLGAGTVLHPRVVLYDHCRIGANCIVHAGAVIGADGLGFTPGAQGKWHKKRHIGNVVIGDNVEIGANSCIDRATYGQTQIDSGCKIDNLVQVAHNVHLEHDCLLCAQVGIAGSTTVGTGSTLGGKSGAIDNIEVPERTRLNAGQIVLRSGRHGQIIYQMREVRVKSSPQ